ncbi:MAG: aldose 1-epimerase [Planctomycetaceae bacterium]
MQPILIRDPASGSSAQILPELGFNCFDFQAVVGDRTIAVLDASPEFAVGNERPSGHGAPILFPFPNRIRSGRFRWDGVDYRLPEPAVSYDRAGNAIHGFCLDRPWRVIDRGEQFVVGEFRLSIDAPDRREFWPADFILTVRYAIRDTTLETRVRIQNPDEKPLPWGFGTHPYFRLPLAKESRSTQCLIEVPAGEEWELIDCLPTGVRRPVPEERDFREGEYYGISSLDDVLTGLSPAEGQPFVETLIYDEPAGLQVAQRFDPAFREAVVFTPPDRDAVCIEPYTCVTDAINLQPRGVDAGWETLAPGTEAQLWIDIEAGPIWV